MRHATFHRAQPPPGLLIPFQAVLWTMEFQTKISFFAGIVVSALLITPFFSKRSFIALGAAAPIEKSAGGMTSVSSDFPRAPARPCKTTRRTRRDRRPPRRRCYAPEVWVGDGAPTLPIWNDVVAPNAPSARQRLSKRDGRDGSPSRPTFAAQPPLLNNTSNSKRSSSAGETALCA